MLRWVPPQQFSVQIHSDNDQHKKKATILGKECSAQIVCSGALKDFGAVNVYLRLVLLPRTAKSVRLTTEMMVSSQLVICKPVLFYITQITRRNGMCTALATLKRPRVASAPGHSGRSDSLFQGAHAHAVAERGWWINDHSVVVLKPVEYLGFFRVALSDLNGSPDSLSIFDNERAPVVGTAE